ncbi:hypothetical protein HPB49_005382 [Dermacentor silvarum]|uniref:Uncharacterized protein n=1 Tax=Dermacentor silvarum TaxID=543639 RepID=A0ACB8DB26_DERSI|nr:hypothetical protein HPB49_005382 [Dermacentor silvarum]
MLCPCRPSKSDRNRLKVEEEFLKTTHAQRQEAAQLKREERRREREHRRELKRRTPKMKQLKAENKFRSHRVTSEVRKSELLLEALPLQDIRTTEDSFLAGKSKFFFLCAPEVTVAELQR